MNGNNPPNTKSLALDTTRTARWAAAFAPLSQEDMNIALMNCARAGIDTACQALIQHGAEVNSRPNKLLLETPLHHAAYHGSVETCQILIDMGAEVDALDHDGRTPLTFAWIQGRRDAALLLVAHGAQVDRSGVTAERMMVGTTDLKSTSQRAAAFKMGDAQHLLVLLQDPSTDCLPGDDVQSLIKVAKTKKDKTMLSVLQAFAARQAMDQVVEQSKKLVPHGSSPP